MATKLRRCLGSLSTTGAAGTQELLPDKDLLARSPCWGQTEMVTLTLPADDSVRILLDMGPGQPTKI